MKYYFFQASYLIKQAYITLKQKPGFVFSVVTTLGASLGTLLCVLSLAYVIFYKPLPYPQQDKLLQLSQHSLSEEAEFSGFDYPTTVEFHKNQQVFTQSAISYHSEEVIRSHPKQVLVNTSFVTPQWFSLLGVPFELGRSFNTEEGIESNIPVAILSNITWRKNYNADRNIINKTINVNDVSYRVIGVTGNDFVDPQLNESGFDTQLWLPWDYNPISYKKDWWGSYSDNLVIFGSKIDSLTTNQISQQTYNLICQILEPAVAQDFADACTNIRIETKTIKEAMIGESTTAIYLLLIGAIALVLISSTNIINLFVAHTIEQLHSFAINAALGAKKSHLVLALIIQVSLLMLSAILLSLLIASGGFYLLNHYLSEFLPLVSQLSLQAVTVIPLVMLAIVMTVVIAKLGASAINYKSINLMLQSGGKGINTQVSSKIRSGLIICQITIASVLVFCSLSITLKVVEKLTAQLGYQRSNLSYLSLSISKVKDPERASSEQNLSLIKQIKSTLLELPQIKNISTAESPIGSFIQLSISDVESDFRHVVETSFADENYFTLIGQPFITGKNFSKQTTVSREQVLIINERFAKRLVANGDVIGKKLDFSNDGSNVFTVIGVVKGILEPGDKEIPMRMYAPASRLATKFLIQLEHNQKLTREQLINSLNTVSALLTISQYKSLADSFNQVLQLERVTLVSTLSLTLISLLLAGIGMYGILSYSTQTRRFEIGTRLAVGAKRNDIITLIIKDNTKATVMGIFASIMILALLGFVFNKELNEYLNWQLLPICLLTLGLISLITFVACYLPLRQYINKPAIYSLKGSTQ